MDEREQEELVITFHNTREAILGEKALLDSGFAVGVMPMPARLGPACGIALRIGAEDLERAKSLLGKNISGIFRRAPEIQGVYEPLEPPIAVSKESRP